MAKKRSRSKKRAKKYQVELTYLSVLLWGVFLFFLLTWVFVLGIFVGRGFLPGAGTTITNLKEQIAKLQEMVSGKKTYDLRSHKKPESDPKLAFYEKLSRKKDEVKNRKRPEDMASKPNKERPDRKVEVSPEPPLRKEERIDIVESPSNQQPEKPLSEIHYTVQLASLGDRKKAEDMADKLIDRGYQAYFYEVKVEEKTYYRVRCGRFIDREKAEEYARRLAEEEGIRGFVSRLE